MTKTAEETKYEKIHEILYQVRRNERMWDVGMSDKVACAAICALIDEPLTIHGKVYQLSTFGQPYKDGSRNATLRLTTQKGSKMNTQQIMERLEYLRGEVRAQRISYSELAELQSLADYIDSGDVELLEAAGVPEEESE